MYIIYIYIHIIYIYIYIIYLPPFTKHLKITQSFARNKNQKPFSCTKFAHSTQAFLLVREIQECITEFSK